MMNRGIMNRQMFRNGGAAFPDLSGDGKVTQKDILMGRGVKMQQGGNPALEAGVNAATEAFLKAIGRPPESLEELQSFALEMERRVQAANSPRMSQAEIDLLERQGISRDTYSELPPPVNLTPEYFQDRMPYSPRMSQGEMDLLDRRPKTPSLSEMDQVERFFPSSELPPPVQLAPEYFQDMMPRQENYYPPRGDMEMQEMPGPVIRRQEGGPAMVMPSDMGAMAQQMPAAAAAMTPPEQEVVMGAMQASGGPEVQQMIASEAQDYGDPETAENYEEMMNMVRGDQATVEERRSELASLVGEQDAMQTPESVLALVQPIVQLSMVEDTMASSDNIDAGVGALAAQEMTTPVQGDMAGGVMTLAGGAEPQMQGMA